MQTCKHCSGKYERGMVSAQGCQAAPPTRPHHVPADDSQLHRQHLPVTLPLSTRHTAAPAQQTHTHKHAAKEHAAAKVLPRRRGMDGRRASPAG